MPTRKTSLIVIASVLVGIFGSALGTAFAGSAGIIHACVQNGQLRIISGSAHCRSQETPLDWNIAGPQGAQGPKGDKGAPGPQGIQGAPGAKGDPGPQGIQGAPGAKGDKGDPGPQGIQGVPGPQGIQGIQGTAGLSGVELVIDRGADHNQFNSDAWKQLYVYCPEGKRIIGGGAFVLVDTNDPQSVTRPIALVASNPTYSANAWNGWYARALEMAPVDSSWDITVYAICANVTQ